ncbi:E3 ubiquitin-protein ligase rnf168 [Trematomus bernacchii]|uniref:E3 ubiquitin-protein ligase rnf168 n=1 Tax=Trematomus bernacchii TaxID=40690 RepID=UPI00146BE980|nr:E3 ubiquitin-protein ligase rnf168 [Trematomus bernacchii]
MSLVSDLEGLSLSLDDCRCPVCLEIFMEPVTLPCSHTFCKVCFLESVDKATLCCPLCRKRVSSWARLHSRKNSMVDQKLWSRIQSSFPRQCERRIRGEEEEPGVFFPRVCLPGELKQEYEDQVSRLTEEKRVLEEEESRQSEELIRRLLQEEQLELQEERKRREEDERLALLLSSQLNATPAAKKKKKEVSGGQMERFLCPLPAHSSSSDGSFMSNKENILLRDAALQEERLEGFLSSSEEEQRESRIHADAGPSSSKRKISETLEDEDLTAPKRGCPSPFSPTVDLTGWESRRQQQEDDDRRLAKVLQKELDQEERQRASDRRKGSADPYLLRQNRGSTKTSSTKTSSTKTSSRVSPETSSRGSTKTSSSPETSSRGSPETSSSAETPSSKTSSSRRSKQATLMEMFSLSS